MSDLRLVIVTGMSGAGKSTAMKMMEDMGFFCIDNLPIPLLDKLVDFTMTFHTETRKIAIGTDVRSGDGLDRVEEMMRMLSEKDAHCEILFLDAEDNVLVKRYKETRRSHPLAQGERVDKGIEKERKKLAQLKTQADYIIDTSRLLTRDLKSELERIFVRDEDYKSLFVTILSFGFKYGIPADSDLVMDVRFLPNPYYIEELRPKTGNDVEIQQYVMQFKEAEIFLDKLSELIDFLIPHYISEGKNQLVISIGCTGGKHRSVTLANELYKRLASGTEYGLKIEHRDIGKDAQRGK
ncbi:MAG: RNase adapter RapZ [Muribaculaceae bacterium]|nr:RNase adapter RapZ [Muribaculaceae bacterium]MCM1493128.1 RNase adapter RapZ [Muribaculaceae bacterium]